jgi:hypothetical protein
VLITRSSLKSRKIAPMFDPGMNYGLEHGMAALRRLEPRAGKIEAGAWLNRQHLTRSSEV